jgi:hypothetical protein
MAEPEADDPCSACGASDWQSLGMNERSGATRWRCTGCGRKEWHGVVDEAKDKQGPTY